MSRSRSIAVLSLMWAGLLAACPSGAHAVIGDADVCFGTGSECVVSTRVLIFDPEGIDVRPLTLRITPTGRISASANPLRPLTIKAGAIVVEKGGAILGNVP